MDRFKGSYRHADVLLIDDVQFLASKAKTEEEFFHTFNALHDPGSQLVLTSDRLPRDLSALEDRLRERFEAGLVTDIEPPDLATRVAVLRKRAQHDGVVLADDGVLPAPRRPRARQHPHARGRAHPRRRLRLAHRPPARPPTSPSKVLADLYPAPRPGRRRRAPLTVEAIQDDHRRGLRPHAARSSSPPAAPPASPGRARSPCTSRASTPARRSPPSGARFGGRNHTTVLHACRRTAAAHGRRPRGLRLRSAPHRALHPAVRGHTAAAVLSDMTDRLRGPVRPAVVRCPPAPCGPFGACAHLHNPYDSDLLSRGGHREVVDLVAASCSPSCRPSRAWRRRAAPCRRSPACRSPPRAAVRAARHRHGGRPARPARGRPSSAPAPSSSPPACCSTSSASCPAATCRSSCARPSRTSRSSPAPRASTSARCAPRTSRRCPSPGGDQIVTDARAGLHRDDRPRRALGLARRDAPDPHRHPRLRGRRRAADGRDRLLSPERQGDAARGRRSPTASRPTCRPARWRSSAASCASDVDEHPHRRARQPGRLRGRRARAVARASSTVSSRTTASCCPRPTSTS